jgi:hypothetical protein
MLPAREARGTFKHGSILSEKSRLSGSVLNGIQHYYGRSHVRNVGPYKKLFIFLFLRQGRNAVCRRHSNIRQTALNLQVREVLVDSEKIGKMLVDGIMRVILAALEAGFCLAWRTGAIAAGA